MIKSMYFGQKRPGKAQHMFEKRLEDLSKHKKTEQKKKVRKKNKSIRKGIVSVDKSLKSKKRTKLGKPVKVNLGNLTRTLGSSTFFN